MLISSSALMEQTFFYQPDCSLHIRLNLGRGLPADSCNTLSISLNCASAASFDVRHRYKAERVTLCGQAAVQQELSSGQHCSKHWFSQYLCCAANGEPVAIAHNTLQLAELLQVPCVLLLDSESLLPLQAAPWGPQSGHAAATAAATADAAASGMAAMEVTNDEAAAGTYSDDNSSLTVVVPRPTGNWSRTPCAALHLLLDVDTSGSFMLGSRPTVLKCFRCGNESGKNVTCSQHEQARIRVVAKRGDIVSQMDNLTQLAATLGVQQVLVNDALQDMQGKLQEGVATPATAAAAKAPTGTSGPEVQDAAAAAAASRSDRGQKRSSADLDDGPFLQQGSAKLATGVRGPQAATGASVSAGPAILRLELAPDMAEAARQEAEARQPSQRQTGIPWQDAYQMQQEANNRDQLEKGVMETRIEVAANCCAKQACMGINLRLAVNGVQELAASSRPIRVEGGRRCGNEGGEKRFCKQHRMSRFILTDSKGDSLPGAAHLTGLASMLKVVTCKLLDFTTMQPLQEYLQLPAGPTWQCSPDKSSFKVWLPQTAPVGGIGKPCCGLDITVCLPPGLHTMGRVLPVVSVALCGNSSGSKAACRRHSVHLLHIIQQGANVAFQQCSTLGELAMWLGVDKVEVLDAESQQPLSRYLMLVDAPVQLSMAGSAPAQALPGALLMPPSLSASPPAGSEQSAEGVTKAAASAGNCSFELLGGGESLLVRVDAQPPGSWQTNPCRALEVSLQLPPGQGFTEGQQYPIKAVQRCSNEAGGKTRCKAHTDGAVSLMAAVQSAAAADQEGAAAFAAGAATPAASLLTSKQSTVKKANTSEQLAAMLGLQSVLLVDKASGQDLGELEDWSASNSTGGAAKVQLGLAEKAALGSVGLRAQTSPNLPLLQQTITALAGSSAASQPKQGQQQTAATPQQEQSQQPLVLEDVVKATVEASMQQLDQQPAVNAATPEASKAGLYRSSNPLLAARVAAGPNEPSKTNAGAAMQLKSSAIAARIAGLESSHQQAQQ